MIILICFSCKREKNQRIKWSTGPRQQRRGGGGKRLLASPPPPPCASCPYAQSYMGHTPKIPHPKIPHGGMAYPRIPQVQHLVMQDKMDKIQELYGCGMFWVEGKHCVILGFYNVRVLNVKFLRVCFSLGYNHWCKSTYLSLHYVPWYSHCGVLVCTQHYWTAVFSQLHHTTVSHSGFLAELRNCPMEEISLLCSKGRRTVSSWFSLRDTRLYHSDVLMDHSTTPCFPSETPGYTTVMF